MERGLKIYSDTEYNQDGIQTTRDYSNPLYFYRKVIMPMNLRIGSSVLLT
jgi:hypothetical protein